MHAKKPLPQQLEKFVGEDGWIECEKLIPPHGEDVLFREYDFDRHGQKVVNSYTVSSIDNYNPDYSITGQSSLLFEPNGAHLDWIPLEWIDELLA